MSSEEASELKTLIEHVARAADGSFISGDHQTDELLQLYFSRRNATSLTPANRLVPLEHAKTLIRSNSRDSSFSALSSQRGSMLTRGYSVFQYQLEKDENATNPVQAASIAQESLRLIERVKHLLERKASAVNPLSDFEVEEYDSLVSHLSSVTTGDAMLDETIAVASAAQATVSFFHLQVIFY